MFSVFSQSQILWHRLRSFSIISQPEHSGGHSLQNTPVARPCCPRVQQNGVELIHGALSFSAFRGAEPPHIQLTGKVEFGIELLVYKVAPDPG